jgi:hypothetical protein
VSVNVGLKHQSELKGCCHHYRNRLAVDEGRRELPQHHRVLRGLVEQRNRPAARGRYSHVTSASFLAYSGLIVRLPLRQLAFTGAFCAFVAVSGGCSSDEVLPAIQPIAHERVLEVQDLVGCYELVSLAWSPPLTEDQQRFYAPPRYFALTSDVLGDPKVRKVKARQPDYHLQMGIWRVSDNNEIEAK